MAKKIVCSTNEEAEKIKSQKIRLEKIINNYKDEHEKLKNIICSSNFDVRIQKIVYKKLNIDAEIKDISVEENEDEYFVPLDEPTHIENRESVEKKRKRRRIIGGISAIIIIFLIFIIKIMLEKLFVPLLIATAIIISIIASIKKGLSHKKTEEEKQEEAKEELVNMIGKFFE